MPVIPSGPSALSLCLVEGFLGTLAAGSLKMQTVGQSILMIAKREEEPQLEVRLQVESQKARIKEEEEEERRGLSELGSKGLSEAWEESSLCVYVLVRFVRVGQLCSWEGPWWGMFIFLPPEL